MFDPHADYSLWEAIIPGSSPISVSIRSYDNAEPKIALMRPYNGTFRKLGRLTVEEAQALLKVFTEATVVYAAIVKRWREETGK